MAIPTALGLFQSMAIVFGAASLFVILRELNYDQAWNKCAPTLNVNQCPYQSPKDSYDCRTARRQMDSYVRTDVVQKIRRNEEEQLFAIYVVAAIVTASVLTLVLYMVIPLNGQLCLGKCMNVSAIGLYGLATYWGVLVTFNYNNHLTSYKERVCSLWSTLPVQDFGNPILRKCFGDYHICQNAVVQFVGLGLGVIAAAFHFLAFFSALWDCQTQIDVSDWGTVENLPEESIIHRPDPPVYEMEDDEMKQRKELYEKQQEKELRKKVQEIEKRKQRELRIAKHKEELRRKEHEKKNLARQKAQKEEQERIDKKERKKRDLERKRLKKEQFKREQEVEKKLGETD